MTTSDKNKPKQDSGGSKSISLGAAKGPKPQAERRDNRPYEARKRMDGKTARSGSPSAERTRGYAKPRSFDAGSKPARTGGSFARRSLGDAKPRSFDAGSRPPRPAGAAPARSGGARPSYAAARPGRPAPERVFRGDSAESLEVGHVIVVSIKRIGINGEGVGYFRKKAVFATGALAGETVKARITKVEPNFVEAVATEIETPSPDRVKPFCSVYDLCGGCQLQHLSYEAQLSAKEELIRESFARYADMEHPPIRPILGMDNPRAYRNKASLQVGIEGKDTVVTGLYSPRSHRLVDISGCEVQDPAINAVMDGIKRTLKEVHVPVYNEKTRQGLLRTVVARVSRQTGQVQLTLVTAAKELPAKLLLIRQLRRELPQLSGISQNVNTGKTPLVFGDETIHLWGKEQLQETLGAVKFDLSPRSFFQLNPVQTVKLYDAVKEAASLTGEERVVDAYCGTGTIGLWLAPQAAEVRGIELVPEAVVDARQNAQASGAANVSFHEGRAEKLLPAWVNEGFRPDVLVVDPPRTGCDDALLESALSIKPKRFVYVSCNPATLAKDCAKLIEGGYKLEWIQPVDMFPHTSHVECVVWMSREKA